MSQFPHLKFKEKLIGNARFFGGGTPSARAQDNLDNRQGHSDTLTAEVNQIHNAWLEHIDSREENGLAELDPTIQPIFLEINPSLIDGDLEYNLLKFGIEIISQEEDGFILGASLDNLTSLKDKIEGFANTTRGSGNIADFYKIITGDHSEWKPKAILSEALLEVWNTIEDDAILELEISIAFGIPRPKYHDQTKTRGLSARNAKYDQALLDRSDKQDEREAHFRKFINNYGEITSSIVDLEDSLGCEVSINGKGLKDLVVNYPFVFDIKEKDEISAADTEGKDHEDVNLEILSPADDAPTIGVIDSGIMEAHKYMRESNDLMSTSYIDGDTSVEDMVPQGGHGTRVAGAVLYPKGISAVASPYQLPFFIRNLRVLNAHNYLANNYPPALMETIVDDNPDLRVFNLSINTKAPFRLKHMSTWAAMLDHLIHSRNILFINSAGNIDRVEIRHHIHNGTDYPEYLDKPNYRLANPAQSSFAIVVGSVNHLDFDNVDYRTLGGTDEISAFSRIGPGIWNHTKPDVVEYGGGMQASKDGINSITYRDTSTELVRSTSTGGPAVAKDSVGTSYAAPKVANIIGHLAKLYPVEHINLWRALLVQGARLPNEHFENPTLMSLRHFGYGIPSLERVTENNDHRVTFYVEDKIAAKEGKIYTVSIPDHMRDSGDEYDVLIEVSMAYTAKTRRTRQHTKSYVGTWLDWDNAKLGEPYEEFKTYTLRMIGDVKTEYDSDTRSGYDTLNWKLGKASDYGEVKGHKRNNSTLQKDYCILKSYELPEELSFAVHAHNGWDKDNEAVPFAFVVSFEVLGQDIPIYTEMRIENEIELEAEV